MKLQKTTKNVFAALALTALMTTPALAVDITQDVTLTVVPFANVVANSELAMADYDGVGDSVTGSFEFTADSNVNATLVTGVNGTSGTNPIYDISDGITFGATVRDGDAVLAGVSRDGFVDVTVGGLGPKAQPGTYDGIVTLTININ